MTTILKSNYRLLGLLFFYCLTFTSAQNYQTVDDVNNACSQLGFASDEDAEIAVDKILDQIGVPRNFTLQECPEINNAVARNIENSAGLLERYILYDAAFFSRMDEKAGNDWAATSILAHEIGHHLSGHALNNKGSSHKFELEADYFSGNALARLGASLEEAQSAIRTLKYERATATHPAKADRLAAIERGWKKAKGITNVKTEEEEKEETAFEFFRKGEQAFADLNYEEAIANFNKAEALGYKDAYFYLAVSYRSGTGVMSDRVKAFEMAKKGYELGSVPATFIMAKFLAEGVGTKVNLPESERLFKKSYQVKWFKDQYKKYRQPIYAYTVGNMYYHGYGGVKEDKEITVIWFRQAAEKNEPRSLNYLGYMYEKGEFFEKDLNTAMDYYRKAAATGYATAEYNIGTHYQNGHIVEKDIAKAEFWYKKAAGRNLAIALVKMGEMYENGTGVEKDYGEAMRWYRKAAEQDYAPAFREIGWNYAYGDELEKDGELALYWLKKAVDHGNDRAAQNIALLYKYGPANITVDYDESLRWYLYAARDGSSYQAETLNEIGDNYYHGHKWFEKNYKEALKFYQKAADIDDRYGQYNLGYMYLKGYGIEKNYDEAVYWFKKSARQGFESAQKELKKLNESWD